MTAQTILQAAKTAQADVKLARKSLKSASADGLDLRNELCENIYPLIESLARIGQRCAEELEELGGVVAEMVEEEESFVTPELSDQIGFALGAGQAIAAELAKLLPSVADELLKKRLEEALATHQKAAEVAWRAVSEATGEEDEEDDEGDGEEEEEHEDLTEPPPPAAESEEENHG